MSGLSERLAVQWLRDRALELRSAANRAESAYQSGSGYRAGRYVAKAYRDAARVLDLAANDAEVDGVPEPLDLCDWCGRERGSAACQRLHS